MNPWSTWLGMLRGKVTGQTSAVVNGRELQLVSYMRPSEVDSVGGWTVERLWASQPHLRTVVDFIAMNIAAIGLHVYEKREDDSRVRVNDGPLATLLDRPNSQQTGPEFLFALAHEITLYDDAFVLVGWTREGVPQARVIPTPWVTVEVGRDRQQVTGYIVNGERLDMATVVRFKGWTPGDPTKSTSPVDALRLILDSEQAVHARRRDVTVKGPRVGGIIKRPKDAPKWSDAGRRTFDETWAAFQPGGERAGDAVLLEDGMDYAPVAFEADSTGYRDGSTLSLSTVAQVFHIHPSILGVPGAIGYQGVREIRRALIGDSLSWLLKRVEARMAVVMERLGEPEGRYAEFNVEAKLRGSFEEQAVILRQSVGSPYLTVNEARAMFNREALEGGDELVQPMNMTVAGGSNRTPEDDAAQQDAVKARVIREFVARRDQVLASKRGAGDHSFDWGRWNAELLEDAARAGVDISAEEVAMVNLEAVT